MRSRDAVDTEQQPEETDTTGVGERGPRQRHRVTVLVAASVALVFVGLAAFAFGRLSTFVTTTPTDTSVEAGFARDMQVHHQQGAELATMVRELTDDPELRLLAYDIAATQTQQSGQMYGWLRAWGLSQAGSEPSMAWMMQPASDGSSPEHDSMGAAGDTMAMPGLATPEQIAQLNAATGVAAERIFLELMMAHHQGAVDMANAVTERTSNTVVLELAGAIIESQTAEMQVMEQMLAERE